MGVEVLMNLTMEFSCLNKTSVKLGFFSGGFDDCFENGIWGRRVEIGKSLCNFIWSDGLKKRKTKTKPGVAFSVLTPDIDKDALVSFC